MRGGQKAEERLTRDSQEADERLVESSWKAADKQTGRSHWVTIMALHCLQCEP